MMSLQMDTRLSLKPQLFTALIFHYAVAALLLTHPHGGRSQQTGQPQPLVAVVGDDVTLSCHVKPAVDAVNVMVEWSRPDLQPRFVHVRRSGEDRLIDQNPSYRGRTSVSIDGLKQGDMSLRLSKVKLSDEGTYRCFVPDLNTDSSVQLVVDVIKITKFSSGVLECKYSGSYPESELLWLDSEGHVLSAGPTETVRGPDGLYTVSRNLTVEKGHSSSFTCRAQEKSTSQIREKHINVPDDFFSDSSGSSASVIIGFIVTIMAVLAVVFGVCKWRQHKNKAGNYNTDEEKGTESEQQSLKEADTGIEKTGIMKNQNKVKEENNTEPLTEEIGLTCQIEEEKQPEKHRTEGESDNVVIQKQSADAGTGSQSVMEKGGQEHDVQKGGETMSELENKEKGTESMSEETQTSSLAESKSNQKKPEENENMRTKEEASKSAVTGTEDEGVMDGHGQQEDTAEGDARTDPDKEENQDQTETTNNKQAGKSSTDERIKGQDPTTGGQTVNNLDNSAGATKSGSEETHTPDPPDPDTSKPNKLEKNMEVRKGEEGTNSVDTGTEGQGLMDGRGQHNRGDTTPTKHTCNATSLQTEVQSPDKKDEDQTEDPGNNKPAAQSSTGERIQGNDPPAGGGTNGDLKGTEETEAKGKGSGDGGDGGDNTTPESPVDRSPDQLKGAEGQNDSDTKDEQTSSDPTTGERRQDEDQTGDGRKTELNKTGSSAKTETGV